MMDRWIEVGGVVSERHGSGAKSQGASPGAPRKPSEAGCVGGRRSKGAERGMAARPSRTERTLLRRGGGDFRKEIQPAPLDFWPTENTARKGGKGCAFPPLPNGECQSLGGVQGALFKGRPCWGSRPQTAGAKPPLHPVGRKGTFDTKCQKCFFVTFAESNKGRRWRGERRF